MKNRVMLVTGGGRGIGRAIAVALASQGAQVAVTARTEDQLNSVVQEIKVAGGEGLAIAVDLAGTNAAASVIEAVEKQWGPVEVLVNNAGIGSSSSPRPIVEFDDEFWELTMRLNVTVPYLLTKRVLPAMLQAGWGRIINIASINAHIPAMHGSAYTASKHALAGFTKATAKEVAGSGVTANAVCPGVTATLMNDLRIEYDARRLGKSAEQIEAEASPLGRRLLPEEVAAMAVFLAGEASGAINGQCINVCGGTVMT
ncbi:MAG: SDR family NAD(P)-dependent oxidoreductase [Planctomycetes bacterium]|nr:SDR family NAD(P)-dependent oxidoreductase [Planctomycetota bacterium]